MLCIATLSSSQSFAKQYYKWTDSKGSTHYTNTPPPKNAKSKSKIDTYGAHSTVTNTPPVTPAPSNSSTAKPQAEQQPHQGHEPVQKAQAESSNASQAQ
ncbi:hypothetical protein B9T28_01875 [Acinetobacter silvestris]|uniref:DUF4124 domain-containing protein n=2 Tax=Acinetobacter silvestris TaxID=1977882 RepID=A0A1Y3CQ13_9GAMM|nr:DUF4124 domain-containing protein [Acinetobacter silvestris]OTG67706.1 hypothetical protein B9T28_01875 [Acinetobacter silvestris]